MSMHRREFLGSAALATAALAAPAQEKKVAAQDKVVVALVGCGGMGRYNLGDFIRVPEVEVAALCDVDEKQIAEGMKVLQKGGRSTSKVKPYEDYRKLIDERKDLDAVIIGTPDHHHAYALIHACLAGRGGKGLDVYCEKPLSHNVVEGRAMVNAARKQKCVVQIGTQQRSGQHFKDAVAYVQSGKLGDVYLCRTWITNRTKPQGAGNPPDQDSPPPGVNYDLWLGPAPEHKFNPNRFHHNFRWFWDYGNGLCNDWGVHLNDIVLWAMKVKAPLAVYATGGKYDMKDNSDTPDTLDVHFQYPSFTHIYTVRQGVYHYGFPDRDRHSHGMEFQGTRGVLTLDRAGWVVTADASRPKPERHGGSEQHFAHVKNFLHCLKNRGEKTASDIEDMHRATTTCHLANISFKVQRRVCWDPEHEHCYRGYDPRAARYLDEDAEANAYLLREPRKPWSLSL
jgi:predicted dehydrogenase